MAEAWPYFCDTQRDPPGCHHNTMHVDNRFLQISFVLQQILIHLHSFSIQVTERRFSVISAKGLL